VLEGGRDIGAEGGAILPNHGRFLEHPFAGQVARTAGVGIGQRPAAGRGALARGVVLQQRLETLDRIAPAPGFEGLHRLMLARFGSLIRSAGDLRGAVR